VCILTPFLAFFCGTMRYKILYLHEKFVLKIKRTKHTSDLKGSCRLATYPFQKTAVCFCSPCHDGWIIYLKFYLNLAQRFPFLWNSVVVFSCLHICATIDTAYNLLLFRVSSRRKIRPLFSVFFSSKRSRG
jgi:hypothetical protein